MYLTAKEIAATSGTFHRVDRQWYWTLPSGFKMACDPWDEKAAQAMAARPGRATGLDLYKHIWRIAGRHS